MARLRALLPLAALLALPGCVVPLFIPVPEGTPGAIRVPLSPGDACGAWRFQGYVGRDVAEVRAAVLDAPVPPRVLEPGQAAGGADPRRVTFVADGGGTVTMVGCG